jgi:hypothetical protein
LAGSFPNGSVFPRRGPGVQRSFSDARTAFADLADGLAGAPFLWLAILFVLVLLRALLRKEWAAATSLAVIMTLLAAPNRDAVSSVVTLVFFFLSAYMLMRFGLLAAVAGRIILSVFTTFPLTTQGSDWYAGISLAGILLMAALAFYGFYTSLGGRPVFGGAVLEEWPAG